MGAVTVHLRNDVGWKSHGEGRARGKAFHDGRLVDATGLARLVDDTDGSLSALAGSLVGEFALVRVGEDELAAAVDAVRSQPLFYALDGGQALVSDRPQWLSLTLDRTTFDPLSEFEFLLAGIITGRDTLYEEIETLQAGETVEIDATSPSASIERRNHFEYVPVGSPKSGDELLDDLDIVLKRVVDRLVEVADDRQIAVPLSGGYDSRLVACLLARRSYPRITTFSFGRRGNKDAVIAEQVAGELGLPWSFVEYTNERWRGWYRSPDRLEYFASAFDYCSAPSIGTCPALDELSDRGVLSDDALVVSGDSITTTGEHVPSKFVDLGPDELDETDVADEIWDVQYDLWQAASADAPLVRTRISEYLDDVSVHNRDMAASSLEAWDWRERQSKFIISPEEYEYGGYDSWLPLFDREYMEFWKTVPLGHRAGRSLHEAYVDDLFRTLSKSGEVIATDSTAHGVIGRLKRTIAASPMSSVAEPLYKGVTDDDAYTSDHLSGYGIVPEPLFRKLYTGAESVHSFKVLDLLGRVSLSPPVSRVPPEEGLVTHAPDVAQDLAAVRRGLPWFGEP